MNVGKTKVMRISKQPFQIMIMVDQKHSENLEYFICLGKCRREIQSIFATEIAAFSKKQGFFTCKLHLNLRKKVVNCFIWNVAGCGYESWTLRKVDKI